jgi:hypothetical protein
MKHFKIEEFKSQHNKNIVRRTVRIKAPNKKLISIDDINKFYNSLRNKGISYKDISISAMSNQFYTLKSFDDDEIKPWDDEDYYQDKASKKTMKKLLTEFYFVDFIIKR